MIRSLAVPALLLIFAPVIMTGCTSTERLTQQGQVIDSLQTRTGGLRAQLYQLRDTLAFYESIETGAYYRDRRLLTDRINALQYDLALARQGGVTIDLLQVDDLFEPASANLTGQGRQRIVELAVRLLNDFSAAYTFRVEGHSDNIPIGPGLIERYPSNWELSAARASALARTLIENGISPQRLVVVSYGDSRPTALNDMATGRSENRRIRIAAQPPYEQAPLPDAPE